ncbi:MAG: adenylosuccinate lyase [Elusimicrobia bacterium CG06_land_8_20_14_3_00_38_11]|nr:MAG: adenylosuccinate lyase [Elusimicrobia bacterium CG06_land_8_20_14_3_00_38_11]
MIERYSFPEMAKIWADENRFQKMLDVEIAVCEALNRFGEIPATALEKIKKKAKFDIKKIEVIEKTVKHDVIAFLTNISENVGKESVYIHRGLTSSDVLDTALALQLKDASELLLKDLQELSETIKNQTRKYKNTLMIGRTHGIHAEPITFGLKLASWYSEILRDIERIKIATQNISFGKISGAVGGYAHIEPEIEKYVMKKLGLEREPVSTQIVPRDRHAQYLTTLSIIATSIERFATEIRTLQRTEIAELEEPFTEGQKGSSAMPHKRNPIICEQLCGLARVIRANALISLENVVLWNERDISHSSTERIIIPDSTILLDYILQKMNYVIKNLTVNIEKMLENLKITKNTIFSQRLLLEIVKKGYSREKIYLVIQKLSQDGFKNKKELKKFLTEKEIKNCFDINYYTRNIRVIYKRLNI